jgi:NAD+ kinase
MNYTQKNVFHCVGIWGDFSADHVPPISNKIIAILKSKGASCIELNQSTYLSKSIIKKEDINNCDLIVTIGGDGTLLNAARMFSNYDIPLVGVNLGRIGFLTDIAPEDIKTEVPKILTGEYIEEQRYLLSAEIKNKKKITKALALNDVVVKVSTSGRMQDFETYVNGNFMNVHACDGLIVNSPTGSTAYALSCGGPIIDPSVNALAVVPICPHALSDRPIIVQSDSAIKIKLKPRFKDQAEVTCDGNHFAMLDDSSELIVKQSTKTVRLLHSPDHNFFASLRSKLSYGSHGSN